MRHRTVPAVLAVFSLLVLFLQTPPALFAAEPAAAPVASPRIERLAQAGRLWGTARYLHPWLAYKDIDWDAALVAALPRIGEARSREEYAAAVQGMLAALGDPVTRVIDVPEPAAETPPAGEKRALYRKLEDGVLVVDVVQAARGMGYAELFGGLEALQKEVAAAEAVVVDLRAGPGPRDETGLTGLVLDEIAGAFVSRPCRGPVQRYLLHSGYRPQDGTSSGGYWSGFLTQTADSFSPAPGATPKRVVFLIDANGGLPSVALALQAAGDARIVSEGPLREDSVVARKTVALGEGHEARLRVSEVVPFQGWPGLRADVELPEGAGETAFQAALREVRTWSAATSAAAATLRADVTPLPDGLFRPEKPYAEMVEPELPWRQLAVIRAWNVIQWFYPYRHLIGDWDAVLPEFLARMDGARTGRDYALALLEMSARVPDGHTSLYGHPEIARIFGEAGLPVVLRWIEDAPVLIELGDEAKQAGLAPGDAILAVDGEPAGKRVEWLSKYLTASTRPALLNRACRTLLRGPAGPVVLTVQSPGGAPREVRMTRDPKHRAFFPQPTGEVVRILPDDLGYVDLTRLTGAEVDGMFEKVRDTRALIFDMRGYPQGTAWAIAPRINTRGAKIGAQFRRAQVSAFSAEESDSGFFFSQPLPENRRLPLYTRPIVMLVDDRAISQSEHSGLFFEAANGTRFIGTPTAGANGDITRFPLPGGLTFVFTGHDVRHADGRQLQRVGLTPDVEVAPTREGIRAGRDEVLERAVKYLEEQLAGDAGRE